MMIPVSQADLKKYGYWDDAKKRFGFKETDTIVTIPAGTTLFKEAPVTANTAESVCPVCNSKMIPFPGGTKGTGMCPQCQG